jgi:hypothetical protein
VPAQTAAGSLVYINWTLLATLALGCFAVVAAGRLRTDATRGYLGFTSVLAAAFAALALLSDLSLPAPTGLAIEAAPALDAPRRVALAVLALAALVYAFVVARDGRSPIVAATGLLAGTAALLLAAFGWAGGAVEGLPVAVHLLVLAAATGGATAAMILGHWYLVTPRLSEGPLVLVARLLTLAVAAQLVLFIVWSALGIGADGRPFAMLAGSAALFVWLRLGIGLLFPLAVSWMAVRTARSRSMESATGLLYIDTAAIVAGTIVAAGLYFGAGLLV